VSDELINGYEKRFGCKWQSAGFDDDGEDEDEGEDDCDKADWGCGGLYGDLTEDESVDEEEDGAQIQ
jgi:hypothetical protein